MCTNLANELGHHLVRTEPDLQKAAKTCHFAQLTTKTSRSCNKHLLRRSAHCDDEDVLKKRVKKPGTELLQLQELVASAVAAPGNDGMGMARLPLFLVCRGLTALDWQKFPIVSLAIL